MMRFRGLGSAIPMRDCGEAETRLEESPSGGAEELVETFAHAIVRKGLATPAVFLLELHKPVAPLGSVLLLGAMPFLAPFVGFSTLERLALFVEERSNVERLIARIEELSRGDARSDCSGRAPSPSAGDDGRQP